MKFVEKSTAVSKKNLTANLYTMKNTKRKSYHAKINPNFQDNKNIKRRLLLYLSVSNID